MPLTKCSKCGEEYDTLYSIHECKKEEGEKKKKEEERWRKTSDLGRIFMYHPEAPKSVRIIAFLLLFQSMGGLGILGWIYLFLIGEIQKKDFNTFLFVLIWMIGTLILSYGLSHLKRWSLYLSGALLISIFVFTKYIYFGPVGLIGFVIVLNHYKKFSY
jgi:hypothetical protein